MIRCGPRCCFWPRLAFLAACITLAAFTWRYSLSGACWDRLAFQVHRQNGEEWAFHLSIEQVVGEVQPKEWSVPSRPRKTQDVYGKAKLKWEL